MSEAAYSIYYWEPSALSFYPDAIGGEYAWGQHYETLQVEKTNEGWHALILMWEDSTDDEWVDEDSCYVMIDEQVFPTKDEAKAWLEAVDADRYDTEGRRTMDDDDDW